ncbi:MAG: acyl-CoA dehydrogenase family protein [Alphaproteobacteria bacterium]|nr:acyl-CoA dehydrogenase family protein [Alphaproteobacteria bacterium]MDX5370043.1 acyl-CoA dehydrogenase family protein [Alphaproteobacteria bacterium]MDX5464617.1 acyl-CoA dehydrogenase family protein [Alphaproteobacteria bacterium]
MGVIWEPELDADARHWQGVADRLSREQFEPLAEELDREQRYPYEHIEVMKKEGLCGLFLPKAYGGQGASLSSVVSIVERVAMGCASTSAILAAYQLGAFPVLLAGTEEQKQKYLGGMAQGISVCFALSERGAGSDAAAIQATATRDGDKWHIKADKCWLGNGGVSQHYIVFARTDPKAGSRGISAFMVDKAQDGVVIDFFEDKMGIRGTLTSNLKVDAAVDHSAMLGEEGRGLRLALQTLNVGRITVAAQAMGIGLAAYHAAARYACERKTFATPIIEHQGIGFKLADMATELSAARMMLYEAAKAYDQGRDVATIGAMAKLYTSEVSHRAVDAAVQIHGGAGYVKPNPVERYYRDQRITEIYEGTSEIQRLVLSRAIRKDADRSNG